MKISKTDNNNFKAKYISTAKINKLSGIIYKPINVPVVYFDRKNSNDIQTITKLIDLWKDNTYIKHLLDNCAPYEKIIGITLQKSDFEKIAPSSILGVLQYYNEKSDDFIGISRFQVRQDAKYNNGKPRKYAHVGKKLIKALMPFTEGKDLSLFAAIGAVKFYEKLGFKHDEENYFTMRLENKKGYLL